MSCSWGLSRLGHLLRLHPVTPARETLAPESLKKPPEKQRPQGKPRTTWIRIELTLHIHGQPAVRCPHSCCAATPIFACQWFLMAFHCSSSTWVDSQRLGVVATTTVWGDRSGRYCSSRWRNPQQLSWFYMEMNMNSVKMCSVSKAFCAVYGGGRPLGSYSAVAVAEAKWLPLRTYGGQFIYSDLKPQLSELNEANFITKLSTIAEDIQEWRGLGKGAV